MAHANVVSEAIVKYNSIPMKGGFQVIYENNKFSYKGLIKLTTFDLMKVENLKVGKSGAFMFKALVLKKGDSIYLHHGEMITQKDWYALAGIPDSEGDATEKPLLTFRLDRVQKLS